jgi:cytochrome P450
VAKATARLYPPGPSGLPAIGSIYRLARDPLRFWKDASRDYGPITHVELGWLHVYMLNDPELIEDVLVTRHRECIKDVASLKELVRLVGLGLVTLEGEGWHKRRKLSAPPLQAKRIAGYVDTMVSYTERTIAGYQEGELRDMHVDSRRLTMSIAAKTLLGFEMGYEAERIGAILDTAVDFYTARLFPWQRILPAAVPTRLQVRFERAMRELDAIIFNLIARLRSEDREAEHLLGQLMRAQDEDGNPLSDRQLRDEAITMLVGGHETTALTITYAVHEMARHPEHAKRLRAEIEAAAPGRPLVATDLPALPFLDAVVRETLRLYPPVHALSRKVMQAFELGGYHIQPGSIVLITPFGMHRNPRWHDAPDRFWPERWLDQPEPARGTYIPFGDGPRVCVGGHFAMAQAKFVLGTFVRAVEMELPPQFELVLQPTVTLRPRDGLPVRIHLPNPQPRPAISISQAELLG